jgi:hypothetical protein
MKPLILGLSLVFAALLMSACVAPCVEVYHSPVIAKANEQVTFTATVCGAQSGVNVDLLVNAAKVKTCTGLAPGQTCSYTGGPYAAYQGTTVSYLANASRTASDGKVYTDSRGYYYFAVTDSNYNWSKPWIPARKAGDSADKVDFIFHRADDYTSTATFIDDVEAKMMNVYRKQDVVADRIQMDKFNFYVYSKAGQAGGCGTVNADTAADIPWRNVDAVLHAANFQDCTSGSHFSAEGSNTKAFLHESGHAVWGLADEYDGCYTFYFEPPAEPNIFSTEAICRAEQTAKSRDPNACWKFTACQGDWWGIHKLDSKTVMQNGMVGDPWGVEGRERVMHVLNSALPKEAMEGALPGVMVVNLVYQDGQWQPGPGGVQVLPCEAPVPHLETSFTAPLVQIADGQGEAVYTQGFYLDPRIVLWGAEPPDPDAGPAEAAMASEGPGYLAEVSIDVAVPLVAGAETFELYESGGMMEAGQAPTISIPIGDELRRYQQEGAMMEEAACQQPVYKPDALR